MTNGLTVLAYPIDAFGVEMHTAGGWVPLNTVNASFADGAEATREWAHRAYGIPEDQLRVVALTITRKDTP